MKKISSIILSIIFAASPLLAFDMPGQPQSNPYQMGAARPMEDLRDFGTPARMFDIMPNRPLVATDANGNKCYYTSTGDLALTISKNGQKTFTLNGVTKTKANDGTLISTAKTIKGTNTIQITNDSGQIIGYQKTGFGGQIVAEYDKDYNKTKTYIYNKYGKTISCIVNEMTKGKTVFDDKGRATYELDYEGNRMASYFYDDKNRLTEKLDAYGNRTHYDGNGAMTYTENKDGVVLMKYNYKYDEDGHYVMDNSFDPTTNETTYFDSNGRQTVTKNYAGAIVADYFWNNSTLVATFNRQNNETTWYDIDGKQLYTTFNDEIINKCLYYKGQLVGMYDDRNKQVTIFKNERRELVLQLGIEDDGNGNTTISSDVKEPTAEEIKKWIDDGLVDKKFLVSPL